MQRNVSADNQIGAKVGDKVVIDMPDFIDIILSAKEHVIPLAIGFAGMLVFYNIFNEQLLALGSYVPFIAQIIVFFVLMSLAKSVLKKISYSNAAKPKQAIKIVQIVTVPNPSAAIKRINFS